MTELLVGPANYAGQAHAWARAAEDQLGIPASSFSHSTQLPLGLGGPTFTFPTDRQFPHPRLATPFGRRLRLRSLARTRAVALDGFVPVGARPDEGVDEDVAFLLERGTEVALISHGSDLRHPQEHLSWFPDSYFALADEQWNAWMQAQVERNQATLRGFPDVPLFVSTPDLLIHQPRATWLPLTVSDAMFASDQPPALARRRPVVLHIPSRRNPPIKGTQFIDPVLQKLHAQGVVEYVSPEGVSHPEMLSLISRADIVVDQLLVGAYGLTAVEAMSMGRLVVAGIAPRVKDLMPEAPPLVEATPETFAEAMTRVLDSREDMSRTAVEGRKFARRWHNGRAAASALGAWLRPGG